MALMTRMGAIVLACATVGGVAVMTEPVSAQSLFERLFGQPRYESRYYYGRDPNYGRVRESQRRARLRQQRIFDAPDVRVDSEKYYTYRPDTFETVSLASLAEVVTASNETDEESNVGELRLGTTPFGEARSRLSEISIRTLPEVGKAIKAFYAKNPDFIWIDNWRINDKARDALAVLQLADEVGLSPADYAVAAPSGGFSGASHEARDRRAIEFEMQLSARALMYALDATRGRIDPNRISGYHDFKRKAPDLAAVLQEMAQSANVGDYLEARSPDNAPFMALKKELSTLREKDEGEQIEIAIGTLLKPGDIDPEVANVVAAIKLRGSEALKIEHEATLSGYQGDGTYTPELVALVRDFQRENDLKADGVVGRRTIQALTDRSTADKIKRIELAMERLRWLPRDLGNRHVFINQPAFSATYVENGRAPLSMRAIVGKKSNQTYFFADKIETVEYNPYWGVPRSIIVNEMLPELYNDPYYLDRLGYEVTTASGQRVSSAEVDWYRVGVNEAPINVRQPPGSGNALGEVKILFPNAHAIYMHDTPTKKLFDRQERAFSHGCVRLQRPREMAAAVLGKSADYVSSRINSGVNESEGVSGDIPVYVAYFTAWPESNGTVHYFDDMYDRDMYLTRAIESTQAARHVDS